MARAGSDIYCTQEEGAGRFCVRKEYSNSPCWGEADGAAATCRVPGRAPGHAAMSRAMHCVPLVSAPCDLVTDCRVVLWSVVMGREWPWNVEPVEATGCMAQWGGRGGGHHLWYSHIWAMTSLDISYTCIHVWSTTPANTWLCIHYLPYRTCMPKLTKSVYTFDSVPI